jgi:hypothetical protein
MQQRRHVTMLTATATQQNAHVTALTATNDDEKDPRRTKDDD